MTSDQWIESKSSEAKKTIEHSIAINANCAVKKEQQISAQKLIQKYKNQRHGALGKSTHQFFYSKSEILKWLFLMSDSPLSEEFYLVHFPIVLQVCNLIKILCHSSYLMWVHIKNNHFFDIYILQESLVL